VDRLTRQQKLEAQQIFAEDRACPDCGGIHQRACPRIKRLELHPNGNRVGVTYFRSFDDTGIVWPEDAFDDEDGADER
jgi:hypothetical protein